MDINLVKRWHFQEMVKPIVGCPNGSTFVKTTFDQDQTLLDGGITRLIENIEQVLNLSTNK